EHALDDAVADEREDARGRAGEGEAAPPGVHDVPARRLGVDAAPGQGRGGDDAEREGGRGYEGGGGEIRVREARQAADAELGREAESEQIAALERERHRSSLEQAPEPRQDVELYRPRTGQRAAAHERDELDRERDAGIRRHAPRERDDAVTVGERSEDDEADDAAEGEAGGGRPVAV